jgi:hypothetical protein
MIEGERMTYLQKLSLLVSQVKMLQDESDACWQVLQDIKTETTQFLMMGQADFVYHNAAHFEKSNNKDWDTSKLNFWRYVILSPSIMMTYNSLMTNEPLWFFYYLTQWGVNFSAFSVIATIVATQNKSWQTTAMVST